jgi:hypothetical protein
MENRWRLKDGRSGRMWADFWCSSRELRNAGLGISSERKDTVVQHPVVIANRLQDERMKGIKQSLRLIESLNHQICEPNVSLFSGSSIVFYTAFRNKTSRRVLGGELDRTFPSKFGWYRTSDKPISRAPSPTFHSVRLFYFCLWRAYHGSFTIKQSQTAEMRTQVCESLSSRETPRHAQICDHWWVERIDKFFTDLPRLSWWIEPTHGKYQFSIRVSLEVRSHVITMSMVRVRVMTHHLGRWFGNPKSSMGGCVTSP